MARDVPELAWTSCSSSYSTFSSSGGGRGVLRAHRAAPEKELSPQTLHPGVAEMQLMGSRKESSGSGSESRGTSALSTTPDTQLLLSHLPSLQASDVWPVHPCLRGL